MHNLANGLKCDVKLYADDTSIFKVFNDPNSAAANLNHDSKLIDIYQNGIALMWN